MKNLKSIEILGADILSGLDTYAENSDNQHCSWFTWNKEEDLNRIFNLWMKDSSKKIPRGVEASAGTFFFHEKGYRSIMVHAGDKPRFVTYRADGTINFNATFKR